MYRIHEIKLNIGEDKNEIPSKIISKLSMPNLNISEYRIIKESIDARDKGDIKFVYSVDFSIDNPEVILKLEQSKSMDYEYVEKGTAEMNNRPVVVGFGPAGIFSALILAEMGYRPIVLERGKAMEKRIEDVENLWANGILNPESNPQFGEGGAGTFSDGKLTTQIKDKRIGKVLNEFKDAGGGDEILYKQKPHIGTDLLRGVVVNLRKKIIDLGGEIRFESKVTGIKIIDGEISAVEINDKETIETKTLVLAIGHSARDTYKYLNQSGLEMKQKPFSIGVRIEHLQSLINNSQYGKVEGLGAAEYKLSHQCKNGRGVYTFCMCPGGEVIVTSCSEGTVVTNGMSNNARDGKNANSGLLVDVRIEDFESEDPLAGIYFQEKYEKIAFKVAGERYKAPKCSLGEFVKNKGGGVGVRASLPDFAVESILEAIPFMGRKLKGFDTPDAILSAVETRSSAPLRIVRDEYYQGTIKGIYPCGEGAGYSGGITSAAVDGIKIAEEIAKKYAK
jgi:uncharacterized FAD-dependent dehydrogenase